MGTKEVRGVDFRAESGDTPATYSQLLYMRGHISGNIDDLGNCFYRPSNGAVVKLGVGNHIFNGVKLFKRDSDFVERKSPFKNPDRYECYLL